MPFIKLNDKIRKSSYTLVENDFIRKYIPDTDARFVTVYIFGLYLAGADDSENTPETIANALSLSVEDVMAAYSYWEETGLCLITENPIGVIYQPISEGSLYKKIKPSKYKSFNKAIQSVITDRMITPAEFGEYYLFLEDNHFEPDALVAVARYCVAVKGADVGYRYIITVASNMCKLGLRTVENVTERLKTHDKYTDKLHMLFKTLGVRRAVDYPDRELYEKWSVGYGFEFNTIIAVAQNCKQRGGMERLNYKLSEYYKNHLLSVKEIELFEENRTSNRELAKEINRRMGNYYQNVDFIVEDYITKWLNMGFDSDTLLTVAKYCSTCSVRTLDGIDNIIKGFYKSGITTLTAINEYINGIVAQNELIKDLLSSMGIERRVNATDRQSYNRWLDWGFSEELIAFAADSAKSAYNPMAFLNRLLAEYKSAGIFTVEKAKNFKSNQPEVQRKNDKFSQFDSHNYTREQLDAMFDALNEGD